MRPGRTMTSMPHPTFIVIGAARCGTTALQAFLGQHPQVYMCPVKEPNFFAFDGSPGELRGPGVRQLAGHSVFDRDEYLALFGGARGESALGEVSPRYMIAEGCAERIRKSLPGVRLIAILRHPVERAWASYLGHRKDGWESCADFRAAFEAEPARLAARQSMGLHFSAGRYAEKLQPYFDRFERSRIHVALYDDLRDHPSTLMADLFRFLEVDPAFEADTSHRHNPSGRIRNPALRFFWQRSEVMRSALRSWIPKTWRDRAYAGITGNLERLELPAEYRARFSGYYRDDILRLADLIGRNLDHWLDEPG
jgi:hypothetical protein